MFRTASNLRGLFRAVLLISWVICCLPFVFWLWALQLEKIRGRAVQFFFHIAGYICGIRRKVIGELTTQRPLMIVSNHSSYMDVFVLGGMVPLSFTPKKEVRSWPIIGFLCVLADCIFVERKPSEIEAAAAQMSKRLEKGKILCLFPEGTTSDGLHIKPFKSGFMRLAERFPMPVQPISILYTHIGNEVMSDARRPEVAWIDDARFFGHFWHLLTLPPLTVEVIIHPPKFLAEFADRKALTAACEQVIVTTVVTETEKLHAR